MARQSDTPLPRPLYGSASRATSTCPTAAHVGLWYDKFCDRWTGQWLAPEVRKPDWIRTIAGGRPIGDASSLGDFARRQQNLIELIKGRSIPLQTESRFVTGLGREHPVDNGFAWHPTLGTPYLPGSSIKGTIRSWASQWEDDDARRASLDEILGCETRGEDRSAQAGTVIILDAIPIRPLRIELDVRTPHSGEYYQEGKPPGDWISPTPIPFLVVAEGAQFQFAFAPRTITGREHLATVEIWLQEALQWLGAGAKTAVGYGRFGEPCQPRQATDYELAHQQRIPSNPQAAAPSLPVAGDIDEAILLEERTRKGGWRARHLGTGIAGAIQNTGDVPSDAEVGTVVRLIVAWAKPTEIAFRYPTDAEEQRAKKRQA